MLKHIQVKKQLRKECACLLGADIGAYNTCLHLCRYCYANYDADTVNANYARHDPTSPFLIGNRMPDDRVHKAEQKSWINGQMTLADFMQSEVQYECINNGCHQ